MTVQSGLQVIHWEYNQPIEAQIMVSDTLYFMPLQAIPKIESDKKGIGFRFTQRFMNKEKTMLSYIAENMFTIDKEDIVNMPELLNMINTTYSQFEIEFDIRKANTPLKFNTLKPHKLKVEELEPLLEWLK